MRHLKIAYSSMHVMSQSTPAYVPTINLYCDQVSKVGGHHGNLNLLFNKAACHPVSLDAYLQTSFIWLLTYTVPFQATPTLLSL